MKVGRAAFLIGTLFVVLLAAAGCDYPQPPPNPEIKPALISHAGWTVKRRYTVNRVLVVDVECRDPERAVEITEAIAQPAAKAYDEVLVYVRPPDKSRTRRVQWTAKSGYRILDY